MALIVQKFGGTSVGTVEKIKNVASRVTATKQAGNDVVVVLSAMSGETNRLVGLAKEAGASSGREYDVVLSTGEQVSIGLLSIILQGMGHEALSMLGSRVPIRTNAHFSAAKIENIGKENILNACKDGKIVVVPGFQGVDAQGNTTTLGRGGSDTTAVALAAALEADLCEIYTDVEGVFTTDPSICSDARKMEKISYDEMLEMASLGAKVLQTRSVQFARRFNVPLMVRSSFTETIGTLVCKEDEDMERAAVSGVTYNKKEAKISVVRVPDRPGVAVKLFKPLSEAGINVDMIVQNISHEGHTDMTFTVTDDDYEEAFALVKETADALEAHDVIADQEIAKLSIVGAGMKTHAGVATKMFETLSEEGINVQMISTSEIKVSVVIDEKYTELAVRVLHDAFGLADSDVKEEEY